MIRICTITLLTLLASAAHAEVFDQAAYNTAVLTHAACTEAAAAKLAKKDGSPHDLAREAVASCKTEEGEIAKHASPETLRHVLSRVLYLCLRTIHAARAEPRLQELCGDCGFLRQWDDKLKIWRPYGR